MQCGAPRQPYRDAFSLRARLVRVRVIAKKMDGGKDVRVVGSVAALQ